MRLCPWLFMYLVNYVEGLLPYDNAYSDYEEYVHDELPPPTTTPGPTRTTEPTYWPEDHTPPPDEYVPTPYPEEHEHEGKAIGSNETGIDIETNGTAVKGAGVTVGAEITTVSETGGETIASHETKADNETVTDKKTTTKKDTIKVTEKVTTTTANTTEPDYSSESDEESKKKSATTTTTTRRPKKVESDSFDKYLDKSSEKWYINFRNRHNLPEPIQLPGRKKIVDLEHFAGCKCPRVYWPVCAKNNITYLNYCIMDCLDQDIRRYGPCINYRKSSDKAFGYFSS